MKVHSRILASLLLFSGIERGVSEDLEVLVYVDLFASETGYYGFENEDDMGNLIYPGPSPDITVEPGDTITFNQGAGSNWYHPIGFAYFPDGAHGETWGAEEREEVEGADDLSYLIDGEKFTCEDVGDTGLDCYEPLFFYPRDQWKDMGDFSAALTITDDVVNNSKDNGGVLYYFCHIHSKMSGRIIIGSEYDPIKEMPLYKPEYVNIFDATCGTSAVAGFSRSGKECEKKVFVPGTLDSPFEECLDAIDCKQYHEMRIPNSDSHNNPISIFSQQMISHHQNAVNMAKLSLKQFENDFDAADMKGILMGIINVQNYQIHQFRNYLGGEMHETEWDGQQCKHSEKIQEKFKPMREEISAAPAAEGCVSSEFNLCMKNNIYHSESGLYEIDGFEGPSPDIHVKVGETYTFDQSDPSNWYHPVGFAYYPDGAHGETWGGDERDEVEGANDLTYLINGEVTTCEDVGDTGLDCYEPEFFIPRGDWMSKMYSAELTITQDVVDNAKDNGGVLYYFCHIHSKMSGRIIITDEYEESEETALYSNCVATDADTVCGTTGLSKHFTKKWKERFICGALDTTFEQCLQSIDYKMSNDMTLFSTEDSDDPVALFSQQMIPHHLNAVNMARTLLKHHPEEVSAVEDFEDILWDIINEQNYQVHQFRAYLGENPADNFCVDYKKPFNIDENTEQTCKMVQSDSSLCDDTLTTQFCPQTCGMCPVPCTDSETEFFRGKADGVKPTECKKVAKYSESKQAKYCGMIEVSFMCPKTCNMCYCK